MEWEAMTPKQWEDLTEAEWEAIAQAEKEREEALADSEPEPEVEEDEALPDAEMEDAEPEPDIEEQEMAPEIEEQPMAPPPPPVEVWSLRAGQAFATNIGAATFSLRAVAVSNTAALESILIQQLQAPGKAWVIPALDNLSALSRVDLLALGIDAHLPILFSNLYTVKYLEACRDWTWEIQTAATAFGGTFSKGKPIKTVCQAIRKVIAGALSARRARSEKWLVEKLNTALVDLKAVKVSTAFFEEAA